MRNESDAVRAVKKYSDTVRRICFIHLKNYNDVEDIFQEVFLKYIMHDEPFESGEHEKAWLIRVTVNACKDMLKSFFRRKVLSIEEAAPNLFYVQENDKGLLEEVVKLPDNYKNVIYLFYYEGYSAVEIAKILNKRENTIYTWLSRAKSKLKETLGGELYE